MLYKALDDQFRSHRDHHCGVPSEPWVVGEWKEADLPIWFDPTGGLSRPEGVPPRRGYFCSDDILWCCYGEFTRYIAAVEVDGASIIHGKTQCWQRMRITSLKAWGHNKACLVADWAEGRTHDYWAARWPEEAALYDMKHYQGQWQAMLDVIFPIYQSLFLDGNQITPYHLRTLWQKPKPEFRQESWSRRNMEKVVEHAYLLPKMQLGSGCHTPPGWVQTAEYANPGSWETIRYFAADHWSTLPEV